MSSLNCYQCYFYVSPATIMAVNGSTAGVVEVNVGEPVSVDTYDPSGQSICNMPIWCEWDVCEYVSLPPELYTAFGDGNSEFGNLWDFPGLGFLHTYFQPGEYTVESAAACGNGCPGAQFIQVAQATVNACAVPVNFRQTSTTVLGPGNSYLRFFYNWDSSSGGPKSDLQGCVIGEVVDYNSDYPFTLPRPPFPPGNTFTQPTQLEISATGNLMDTHGYNGVFAPPYAPGANVNATQIYYYRCQCKDAGNAIALMGPLTINRSVEQNTDGTWKYTVTKPTDGVATYDPLPE